MIFKGLKWRKAKNIITLPMSNYKDSDKPNYLRFGKLVPPNIPIPANAVLTDYYWYDTDTEAWAIPINPSGWSLTNFMYGPEEKIKNITYQRVYCQIDGLCYTTKIQKNNKN